MARQPDESQVGNHCDSEEFDCNHFQCYLSLSRLPLPTLYCPFLTHPQTDKPGSHHTESVVLEQRILHMSRYMQLTGLSAAVFSFSMCGFKSQIRPEGKG